MRTGACSPSTGGRNRPPEWRRKASWSRGFVGIVKLSGRRGRRRWSHGSGNHAGGGGGGGVLSNLNEDDFGVDAGTYSIIVGDGGLASQPGYASVFAGLTAVGGGAGVGSTMGLQGGSGGGGGAQNSVNVWAGGFPVAGQGRAGGKGVGYEAGGGRG
jgi:hypothetical protein